jgi:hypothetical protein
MKRLLSIVITILLSIALLAKWQGPARTAATATTPMRSNADAQVPCSPIPTDVTAQLSNGYGRAIDPKDQHPFDEFSWQTFVALNCPAVSPAAGLRGRYDNIPRIWETYLNAEDLFLPNQSQPVCPAGVNTAGAKVLRRIAKNAHIKASNVKKPGAAILEAVGGPLIDRNMNFTLYEIHLNPDEVKYVKANNLQTLGGQFAFKQQGKTVNFPAGPTPQFGPEGAIEVKASWRILDPSKGDNPERFYTRQALIYVDGANTQNGQPLCIQAVIGLVGLHIIHKTKNFTRWIWSSFEQIDNVPNGPGQSPYSYNSPGCVSGDCYPPNTPAKKPAGGVFKWAPKAPYAAAYSPDGAHGAQVVRSVPIYSETDEVNNEWRTKLAGTVWANYHLIGSQWSVELDQPPPQPIIGIPAVLGNTTLETYIQPTASCVNCHHDFAQTAFGQNADFSFVLGMVPLLKSGTTRRPH